MSDPVFITLTTSSMLARTDYAANCGNTANDENGAGPGSLALGDLMNWAGNPGFNGPIYQLSRITMNQLTKGTSNVILVSEKRMNMGNYLTGADPGENECMYVGMANDVNRTTSIPPARDLGPGQGNDTLSFGSTHLNGLNVLSCDGSVRLVDYTVDPLVWFDAPCGFALTAEEYPHARPPSHPFLSPGFFNADGQDKQTARRADN